MWYYSGMIYTVTYNPSLDLIMRAPAPFALGQTNRADFEAFRPGGKGINVALALRGMGLPCRAFAFTSGFVGEEIERRLLDDGLDCEFIRVSGNNRVNVKIKSGEETELNGIGAPVADVYTNELIERLSALGSGDWLDLSGNAARGTNGDIYARIMSAVKEGVRVVVDAHGELLRSALPYKPFLVKPNLDELSGLYAATLTADDVPLYARKLRDCGARNVIVSLGGDGAVMAAENGKLYAATPPKGDLVNSTGAGDSMVAGFIAACEDGLGGADAFRFAVAAGSACAYGEGLATRENTEKIINGVTVREL